MDAKARWRIVFHRLGLQWRDRPVTVFWDVPDPGTYQSNSSGRKIVYQPDFFIPALGCYWDVDPDPEVARYNALRYSKQSGYLVVNSTSPEPQNRATDNGLIVVDEHGTVSRKWLVWRGHPTLSNLRAEGDTLNFQIQRAFTEPESQRKPETKPKEASLRIFCGRTLVVRLRPRCSRP